MAKVVAILLQSGRVFFETLQKVLVYFFVLLGFSAVAIAFISFQNSVYGFVCFGVGMISMLVADYVSKIK